MSCCRAGLRTAILEAKRYAGGMASTVELFDGFRFEIAGSLQFPTSAVVSEALGLGSLPTVDLEVMSVSMRGDRRRAARLLHRPHAADDSPRGEHGSEVVMGMAELAGWAAAPTRALGRFDVETPPRTARRDAGLATDDAERRAIQEMFTASASDVLDRFIPDKEKHGALRGHARVPRLQQPVPRAGNRRAAPTDSRSGSRSRTRTPRS